MPRPSRSYPRSLSSSSGWGGRRTATSASTSVMRPESQSNIPHSRRSWRLSNPTWCFRKVYPGRCCAKAGDPLDSDRVCWVSDPVGSGFVTSLARPEGDLTGMMQYESGIIGKWLAMPKEVAPALARVGLSPIQESEAMNTSGDLPWRVRERLRLNSSQIRSATMLPMLSELSKSFARVPEGGLLVVPDATIIAHRDLFISLAARYRLPAVYPWRYFVAPEERR